MTASTPEPRRRLAPGWIGNVVAGLALAAIALALLRWQNEAWAWPAPGARRTSSALLLGATYLLLCGAQFFVRVRRRRHAAAAVAIGTAGTAPVLIAFASQTGYAEELAQRTAQTLHAAGVATQLLPLGKLDAPTLARATCALFVVSTTGEGDAPDGAARFVREVMDAAPTLVPLKYGVLALGDRNYANFCAFGQRVAAWLQHNGGAALFDTIEVDDGDANALRNWQQQLRLFGAGHDLPDWQATRERWRLVERRLLNPGSAGEPCFHVALAPLDAELPAWRAGDIAQIIPRNAADEVAGWLAAVGIDGDTPVHGPAGEETLSDVATRARLPAPEDLAGLDAQAIGARLCGLPHREYSIASLPEDGQIELLVRQGRRPDGRLGIGAGWLTAHATPGAAVALRVRSNPNFHLPVDPRPLILIGNGTGIAGLRALLKQRHAAAHHRNWLLFGERNAAQDFHYRDEILAWHRDGAIDELDLVFSRDRAQREYVQHRLRDRADGVRAWIAEGAALYVCGSLVGMAPGVDAALRAILGNAAVDSLADAGRYRRDVY